MEDRNFKPALESILTIQGPFLMSVSLALGRQTHGAVKNRSKQLTLVKMREYSNGMKSFNIHKTSGCFHKGSEGSLYLAIIRGKRERKMANWPLPDGIAFNPYYGVLLWTRRLEKSDKPGSNATVNLHFYAYINKKGIQVLWSGSTWRGLWGGLYWSSVGSGTVHIFITYWIAGCTFNWPWGD